MKKLLTMGLTLGLCLSISGCGGSSEENIDEKITDIGWEVDFDKDAGTAYAYIILEVNDNVTIQLFINKESKGVDTVAYTHETHESEYTTSYDVKDKFDFSGLKDDNEITCIGYKLDDDAFIEEVSGAINHNCSSSVKKDLKAKRKERDKLLDKHDISLDDLIKWGNWYYKKHK